eukprot:gene13511-13630_t
MFCEEFGLIGAIVLLLLYAMIIVYNFNVALSSRTQFGRLVGIGLTTTFFLYAFINMAMRIIDCLKINYGIEVATLTFLPLDADIHASVYKAQTHNKSSYFVKLKHGHHDDISAIIIELLRNAGIEQIIPIVKTIRGQTAQWIDGFILTVYPFIDGHDGFSRDLTNDQWYTLGKAMCQIHGINVPAKVQAKIRQESYSPKWRQAVRSLYPLIEYEPSGDMIAIELNNWPKWPKNNHINSCCAILIFMVAMY